MSEVEREELESQRKTDFVVELKAGEGSCARLVTEKEEQIRQS